MIDWADLADDVLLFDLHEEHQEYQERMDRAMQESMNYELNVRDRSGGFDESQLMADSRRRQEIYQRALEHMPKRTVTKHEAKRIDLVTRNKPLWPRGVWRLRKRPKKAVMDKLIALCPFDDQRQVDWILKQIPKDPARKVGRGGKKSGKTPPAGPAVVRKLEEESGGLYGGQHPGFRQLSDDELKKLTPTYTVLEAHKYGVMLTGQRCGDWGKYVAGEIFKYGGASKILVCHYCSKVLLEPDFHTGFGFHIGCHKIATEEGARMLDAFLGTHYTSAASSFQSDSSSSSETATPPNSPVGGDLTALPQTNFPLEPVVASVMLCDQRKKRRELEKAFYQAKRASIRNISKFFMFAWFKVHAIRVVRSNLRYADSTNLTKRDAIAIFRTMNKIPTFVPIDENDVTIKKKFMPNASLPVNGVLRFVGIDKVDSVHYKVDILLVPNLFTKLLIFLASRWILYLVVMVFLFVVANFIPHQVGVIEDAELKLYDIYHLFIQPTIRENTLHMLNDAVLGLRWVLYYVLKTLSISGFLYSFIRLIQFSAPSYYCFTYIPKICANLASLYGLGADAATVGSSLHQNIEKMGRFKWPVVNLKEVMLGCEIVTGYMIKESNFYLTGPMEILGITGCYTHWTLGLLLVKWLLKVIEWMKYQIYWWYPTVKNTVWFVLSPLVEKMREGRYTVGFGLALLDILLLLMLTHIILPLLFQGLMHGCYAIFLSPFRFVWWLLRCLFNLG